MQRRRAGELRGLRDLVNRVYLNGRTIGSGSSATALREENTFGVRVKGKLHTIKSKQLVVRFERWLQSHPNANPGDRAAAENIVKDMKNSMGMP